MSNRRRGFSLLELLIALGLLLAIAAIALPVLIGRLEATTEQATGDAVRDFVQMVRARAQLRGEALEVVATAAEDERPLLRARVFDPAAALEADAGGEVDDAVLERMVIEEPWVERALPRGVVVMKDAVAPGDDPALRIDDEVSAQVDSAPIRVVVLLADGSALPGEPVYFNVVDTEAMWEVIVDPWTGEVEMARVAVDSDENEEFVQPLPGVEAAL